MEISIILVLVVAALAGFSIKQSTTYGWFQSTVLGLLCAVPFIAGLIVDALNFLVSLSFRLAFGLGGTSSSELIAPHLTKKGAFAKVVIKGDESKKDPNDLN